ncbi:hypothetical protein BD309DRAFT_950626 [Dichomitus squalens]|nr:hypothetical protein BD309DRAFT_950626 [Dichomitus squalens]
MFGKSPARLSPGTDGPILERLSIRRLWEGSHSATESTLYEVQVFEEDTIMRDDWEINSSGVISPCRDTESGMEHDGTPVETIWASRPGSAQRYSSINRSLPGKMESHPPREDQIDARDFCEMSAGDHLRAQSMSLRALQANPFDIRDRGFRGGCHNIGAFYTRRGSACVETSGSQAYQRGKKRARESVADARMGVHTPCDPPSKKTRTALSSEWKARGSSSCRQSPPAAVYLWYPHTRLLNLGRHRPRPLPHSILRSFLSPSPPQSANELGRYRLLSPSADIPRLSLRWVCLPGNDDHQGRSYVTHRILSNVYVTLLVEVRACL